MRTYTPRRESGASRIKGGNVTRGFLFPFSGGNGPRIGICFFRGIYAGPVDPYQKRRKRKWNFTKASIP